MAEFWWRIRAAFWYWWHGCFWWEVGAACSMARGLEYPDDFHDAPRDAVLTDISYWEE